ncbi:hypothetical protein D3C86_1508310 [compost metagenome]
MPAGQGEALQEGRDLPGEGGGRHRLGQEAQARALGGELRFKLTRHHLEEAFPGGDRAVLQHHLRTIRVVKAEDRGLGDRARRAQARGVIRVALDLGGPSRVTLDQQAGPIPAERHARREEERLARDDGLRLANVRDDLAGRARTGAQARQGQRGAHQVQEAAPAQGRLPLGKLPRDERAHFGRIGELFEAAPVGGPLFSSEPLPQAFPVQFESRHLGPHRWQVEQSERDFTLTW